MSRKNTTTLPTAKIKFQGKIVSEPNELTKLLGEEYGKVRLRKRPVHPLNKVGKELKQILTKLKKTWQKRNLPNH